VHQVGFFTRLNRDARSTELNKFDTASDSDYTPAGWAGVGIPETAKYFSSPRSPDRLWDLYSLIFNS